MLTFGAHRGYGCTDSAHAQSRGASYLSSRPVENSLAAIGKGFKEGAKIVEIDVVPTVDGKLVLLHSVKMEEHFFGQEWDGNLVCEKTVQELKGIQSGALEAQGKGEVAELSEVLEWVARFRESSSENVYLNVELKGTKWAGLPRDDAWLSLLSQYLFPGSEDFVIFSSFSFSEMLWVKEHFPDFKRGMLFDVHEVPFYENDAEQTLLFKPENIAKVQSELQAQFLHPEIETLTEALLARAARLGVGVNAWSLHENFDKEAQAHVRQLAVWSEKYGLDVCYMTDFLPEYSCDLP